MSTRPSARKCAALLVLNAFEYAREKSREDASGYRFTRRTLEVVTERIRLHESFMIELEDELLHLKWHLVHSSGGEYAIFPFRRAQQWPALNSKRIRKFFELEEDDLIGLVRGEQPLEQESKDD
ncbi:hypothetical protein [Paraburkholderia sp. Ac-20347]|uniref:hypothetical protein n=1 Tax=Paraburkholderia sp. Ac-20347 TaxID=2703892 RepID=UPI001980C879|nr:hypothetical protein [Paraburkholderia sp. Ac-20347]MBN3808512.1 hypothetical protein [Paraburkholderia sp. Ac-20347]